MSEIFSELQVDVAQQGLKYIVQYKLSDILQSIETVQKALLVRSFLSRHKSKVRNASRRRELEQHKESKHQFELVLEHFRNVYHAEALAQIQWHITITGKLLAEFSVHGRGCRSSSWRERWSIQC